MPELFEPFLAALKVQGNEGYCLQLPSSDLRQLNVGDISNPGYDRDPPPNGYPQPSEDVVAVNGHLTKLINKEGKASFSSDAPLAVSQLPQLLYLNSKQRTVGGRVNPEGLWVSSSNAGSWFWWAN